MAGRGRFGLGLVSLVPSATGTCAASLVIRCLMRDAMLLTDGFLLSGIDALPVCGSADQYCIEHDAVPAVNLERATSQTTANCRTYIAESEPA